MDFSGDLIDTPWLWIGYALYALIMSYAIKSAPWHKLRDPAALNIWIAAIFMVILFWAMRVNFDTDIHLHFLGAMLLTLMFGWHFAILALTLVTFVITLLGNASWSALGINMLLFGVIPVSIGYLIFLVVEWKLPKNYFIYLFITAFGGAIISISLVAIITAWFLLVSSEVTWMKLTNGYLQYFLLLAYPEGFITGMLISIFVMFRPRWVYTFRDEKYLVNK